MKQKSESFFFAYICTVRNGFEMDSIWIREWIREEFDIRTKMHIENEGNVQYNFVFEVDTRMYPRSNTRRVRFQFESACREWRERSIYFRIRGRYENDVRSRTKCPRSRMWIEFETDPFGILGCDCFMYFFFLS